MKNKLISNLAELGFLTTPEQKKLGSIFSDKTGIVNAILERFELSSRRLYMFQCLSAQAKILFGLPREVSSGGLGVSKSRRGAFLSCIGEAIERYCMSFVPESEVINSKWADLPVSMKQDDFDLYSSSQYKSHTNFNNPITDKITWTLIQRYRGEDSPTGKQIYWPASLVYLPFPGKTVAEVTSTGVAAHQNINSAILSGLLELIERDALMINFSCRLNPPEIVLDSITDSNADMLRPLRKYYNIKIYKLYSDIALPIYLTLIWRTQGSNLHYGIGACAHNSSNQAIEKSLQEAQFTYFYSKNLLDLKPKRKNQIKTLYEHFLYYQDKKFFKMLFTSKSEPYQKENISNTDLFRELRENKLEVYYKDLTTSDIRQATNIKVVRVVVPGLIDLSKTHGLMREKARRLLDVPKKLGLTVPNESSSMPHPFP